MEITVKQKYTPDEYERRNLGNIDKEVYLVEIKYDEENFWIIIIDKELNIYRCHGFGRIDMSKDFDEKTSKEIKEKIDNYKEEV